MADNIIPIKPKREAALIDQPYVFEGTAVRIKAIDGEPWFVLADVCKVLEIGNSRMAADRLDDDEKAAVSLTDTSSNGVAQARTFTIINEAGMYRLVLRSDKPAARRFQKWVVSEVLPSIRKTGSYGVAPAPALDFSVVDLSPKGRTLVRGLLGQVDQLLNELDSKDGMINELAPKAVAYDSLTSINESYCFTDVGHMIKDSVTGASIGRKRVIQWLVDNKWIYKRTGEAKEPWKARQDKEDSGFMYTRVHEYDDKEGKPAQSLQARVTIKGVGHIARNLGNIVDRNIIIVEND